MQIREQKRRCLITLQSGLTLELCYGQGTSCGLWMFGDRILSPTAAVLVAGFAGAAAAYDPALRPHFDVLVIYMALKHIETIANRLVAAGRRPEEPVAIVSRATLPEQAVLETTLGT